MSFDALFIIAVALAMDSFAVSVSTGLCIKKFNVNRALKISLVFALFQGSITALGWGLGFWFERVIGHYDHWVAFGLLAGMGGKMIWEALKGDGQSIRIDAMCNKTICALAFATSIDAFAVGLSFSLLDYEVLVPSVIIGLVTLALSLTGVIIGAKLGRFGGSKFEVAGGLMLIIIGVHILNEHLVMGC